MQPAGLWQRSAAWTLDASMLGPSSILLTWPLVSARAGALTHQMDNLLEACGHAMGRAIIDGIPLPALGISLMQDPLLRQAVAGMEPMLWSLIWPPIAWFIGLSAAFHVGFESGRWRATPGQRLLGLQVTDTQGQLLHPGRALLRHVAGAASWLTLNLGHLMAAAPPSHLALHDRLSKTRVWAAKPRMPAWAVAWLALVVTGLLALLVWWMASAMETMQIALEQALG